ncbi:hypothetical protein GCM10008927_21540 [Amylibacter ulvae]|uniref:Sulfatase N-terminal domain-containing protein n=2 Tax=Paramylibacter ulvae TaxID=1651968 RepID=A0ABQ3D4N7_9RHOB|nr:hypothetical protein GCM10008927_21540 [Amylibacter ulvae]
MIKHISMFTVRFIAQFLFCLMSLYYLVATAGTRINYVSFPEAIYFYAFVILFVALFFFAKKQQNERTHYGTLAFWLFILLISMPFALLKITLGTNDMEPIILFFRDNGMEEVAAIGRGSFASAAGLEMTFVSLLILSAYFLNKILTSFSKVLLAICIAHLAISPLSQYVYRQVVPNPVHANYPASELITEPEIIARPTTQKNLILVYLESLERSYVDLPETKQVYKQLQALEDKSINATNVDQTIGTSYTIAGMVGTQCGVPLLPKALNNGLYGNKNSGVVVETFMPKIRCLGDILSEDGYILSYMNGASTKKYSKRGFLASHGFSRFFDEDSVPMPEQEGRRNIWGFNDEVLFDKARDELSYLASQDKPFVFSMLTLSTHGPDGFLDTTCEPEDVEKTGSGIPDAIRCTAIHLQELNQFLDEKGLSENTIVAVMSDHFARSSSMTSSLSSNQDARRNLFYYSDGSQPRTIDKEGIALDIYPTLLNAMGYDLVDGRANMGVSLLSETPSLRSVINDEIILNSIFQSNHTMGNYLWRDE